MLIDSIAVANTLANFPIELTYLINLCDESFSCSSFVSFECHQLKAQKDVDVSICPSPGACTSLSILEIEYVHRASNIPILLSPDDEKES